jgi:hypothetical protein
MAFFTIRVLSTFDVRHGAKVRPTASCVSVVNVCRCRDRRDILKRELILLADNIKSLNNTVFSWHLVFSIMFVYFLVFVCAVFIFCINAFFLQYLLVRVIGILAVAKHFNKLLLLLYVFGYITLLITSLCQECSGYLLSFTYTITPYNRHFIIVPLAPSSAAVRLRLWSSGFRANAGLYYQGVCRPA